MQRLGNEIHVVTSANALQPDEQNDNGWDQGLLFFNADKTWRQPAYFVTQMKAMDYLPLAVRANVSGRESVTFDVTALKSTDGTTLALHVVNMINVARAYAIHTKRVRSVAVDCACDHTLRPAERTEHLGQSQRNCSV